jgi:signal peptide peptidase SppA
MTDRVRYRPASGSPLAIERNAINAWFPVEDSAAEDGAIADDDGIATVTIRGPLDHHASWWWENYESIVDRVRAALEDEGTKAVVLRIDSPGGLVSGCAEAHRKIRALRAESGKPIFAYVDECAASAAYWLACSADEIWLPDTGLVGSIGVITALYDTTESDKKWGVRIQLIASGAYKTDSHPNRPLTTGIIKRAQDRVDYLAEVFFDAVASARGLTAAKVAGLQAGIYQGSQALPARLADGIAGWDEFRGHVMEKISMATKTKPTSDDAEKTKGKGVATAIVALLASLTPAQRTEAVAALGRSAAPGAEKSDDDEDAEDEDEDAEDEEEESEDDDEDAEDEESTGSTSSTSARAVEEGAFLRAKSGLYTPSRLVRLLRQATGEKGSIKALFGAVDAIGQARKSNAKNAKRIEKLEAESRAGKVDGMIAKARAEGRITRKQVDHLRAQGMKDPGFLKGFLGQLPKLARTADEAVSPRIDDNGNLLGSLPDQQKQIVERAKMSLSDEQAKIFDEEFAKAQKKLNGAASRTPLT